MNTEILAAREEWLPTVRTDHAMRQVPAETFAQVVEWHHHRHVPQYKLAELAKAEGLERADLLPGKTALSEFFSSFSPVLLSVLRRKAALSAEEVLKEADASPVDWCKALRAQLGPEVFRMMQSPEADPKVLIAMLGQLRNFHGDAHDAEKLRLAVRTLEQRQKTDAEKLELAERKVKLLEAKAGAAGDALGDEKLSDAEKAARIREIFGISAK